MQLVQPISTKHRAFKLLQVQFIYKHGSFITKSKDADIVDCEQLDASAALAEARARGANDEVLAAIRRIPIQTSSAARGTPARAVAPPVI